MNNILIGEGLETIKFGMSREEVKAILGEPTEIETETIEDEAETVEVDTFHYDEQELSLLFDSSVDFKLISIATSSEDTILKERKLIGLTESDLLDALDQMGFEDITDEDFESDSEGENMFSSEEYSISFYVDNNEVTEIIFNPEFTEEGEIIWPAK